MLVLLTFVLCLASLFVVSSSYYYCFFAILFSTVLLLTSPYFFSYSSIGYFLLDEVTLFMTFMLLCVVFLSFFWVFGFHYSRFLFFLLFSMLLVCYVVFGSSSLLLLYISYEVSLIPIILIIVIWGSYPERSLSSLMLLIYTSVFTIPFIYVIFIVFSHFSSFHFTFFDLGLSPVLSVVLFCVFSVKLPVYGLHFWLPMAHVEAPTFGSMILAGVLLKLGGVGLIRCYCLLNWGVLSYFSIGYFLVFLLYVTVVCSFQSDFNRLVAYSSVSHMIVIPVLMMCYSSIGLKSIILILLFHGFSSPLLFSLVGYVYSIFNSRQLVSIRGVILSSPLLSIVLILAFMFSLCVPPFPSYVSEVMFFISSISIWYAAPFLLALFSFLSLIYNLNWLSSTLFSTSSGSLSYCFFHYSYTSFYSIVMFSFVGLTFILHFMCV